MTSHRQVGVVLLSLLFMLVSTSTGYPRTPTISQPNPVPLVNVPLVPDSAAPGGPDFKLTVNGTGFVSESVVQWNGETLATNFVSNSQLTATVPAADIAAPGTASVSVVNPAPGGGSSNISIFDIRVPFDTASFGHATLPAGARPIWVWVADLNRDGNLDVAGSLFNDSAVSVSLGEGDGTFQSPVAYPVGGPPSAVLAADFNSDGKADIAVTRGTGFVSILLGNGDGTFQAHKDFVLGEQGISLTTGDFNDDGNLDLGAALVSGRVAVLLGNGDGTFQQAAYYEAGSNRAFGVTTGDLNNDGKLDLAVTVWSDDAVSILSGNGDGTFRSGSQYPTQAGPQSLVEADFNGDGNLDLAVQTQFGSVSVLLGKGDGTFLTHVDYSTSPSVYGIAAADLNGDGKLDLVVPGFTTLSTFLGRGDGTFWRRSDFATGSGALTVAAGEFDADGRLDLVTADSNDNNLSVLPQVISTLSRTYVKFGNVRVGDTSTRKVTLTNIGDISFTINRIALVGSSKDGYTESNDCGSKLAPGESCKFTIVFKPISPIPYRHARVRISDTAADVPQKIYLVGTGIN